MKQQILKLIDRKIPRVHPWFAKPILQELRSEIENMDEWIPVTERLPEGDEEFIVYDVNDDVVTTAEFSTDTGKFDLPFGKVTKWQPLPPNN